MPPWQFIEAMQGVNTAGVTSTRMITFTPAPATTKIKPGDQLVAVFASQAAETFASLSTTWAFADAFTSPTRGFAVYRRIATDTEPSSYVFNTTVSQETIGVLLVYRGLDNAAAILGASGADFAAVTSFPCPTRTLTRYSDLYLGLVLQVPSVGGIVPPVGANERIEVAQNVLGTNIRLEVYDLALELAGATGAKSSTSVNGTASSGAAASVALQGATPPIAAKWLPIVPGAIGLPTEGI